MTSGVMGGLLCHRSVSSNETLSETAFLPWLFHPRYIDYPAR